ncbi:hypothetical protein BDQ94DRAFT_148817 [Aspergillus welwitschiae]|uniref:Uncharacterized protein n=1 Tax=Aspergillus welwitschiae TaxID=1341132 RepID=A0A3F3PTQ2_9EURO|nr:hypothetical protein BDQ94DRAFT_148817 [Aspergillus welwitschiae]RDH30304.1 hypothetical protein BDQ94DRAFT_148817 [Aspergillus welwitschiae]
MPQLMTMEKHPETTPESDRNEKGVEMKDVEMKEGGTEEDQGGENEWVERCHHPDEMTVGGYAFHIKHGVPQEHRDELWKLWDIENFTYEDIPEHLKVYEFTPEEYEDLEREEPDFRRGTVLGAGQDDEDKDEDKDEDQECLPGKP